MIPSLSAGECCGEGMPGSIVIMSGIVGELEQVTGSHE